MAKKLKSIVKLQIPAGKANPAPPVGPRFPQVPIYRPTRRMDEQLGWLCAGCRD